MRARATMSYLPKGYGTEAAKAIMHYGLRTLRLPLLVSAAFPENVASIRIMQKIGMQEDGFGQWNGRKTVRYIVKSTSPSTGLPQLACRRSRQGA